MIASGGTASFWTGLAGSVVANNICTETQNVYYDIRYYWQESTDPYYAYYVKQVFYCYSDSARTDYIGMKKRYYHSTIAKSVEAIEYI